MGRHATRPGLDRASELRAKPEALEGLARDAAAMVIFHRGSTVPVSGGPNEPVLVRVPASSLLESRVPVREMSFLGLLNRAAVFGFELPEAADELLPADARWLELIVASMTLPIEDATLMHYVVGLANWRRTHVFCPQCGQAYTAREGGHVLVCP